MKIANRAEAWLAAQGFGPDDAIEEEDDTQATLHAAAVAGHSAFEPRRASRTQRLGGREVQLPALCAACDGYTLHAAVSIGAKDRPALERLCRYVLRPPLAKGRLVALEDGRVALRLRRPWSDGTTEKVFTREQLVERLASMVPPRQANQVLYHGVLAARSSLRSAVVPSRPRRRQAVRLVRPGRRSRRSRWEPWAELLRRVFGVDALKCPGCGGRLHLRAVVVGPPATTKILRDLARGAAGPP